MPVKVLVGDLLESQAQTLVNTVNCVGVMGRGIALAFRKRFPDMYADYVRRCETSDVALGQPYVFQLLLPPMIVNFPTKDHWRGVARITDITAGLDYLEANYEAWGITSLAVPPLGCGEGQLEWRIVGPELYRRLARLQIPVELYAPFGTPDVELEASFLAGRDQEVSVGQTAQGTRRVPIGWFALVEIIARLREREPARPVGRITLQKLAYFATVAGVPTNLTFDRASYGPFAPSLKRVTSKLVNNGLLEEHRSGNSIVAGVGPTYPDAKRVFASTAVLWGSQIDRVVELLANRDGRQVELAATALYAWAALTADGKPATLADLEREVAEWKSRRRPPVTQAEIIGAISDLAANGWLETRLPQPSPLAAQ